MAPSSHEFIPWANHGYMTTRLHLPTATRRKANARAVTLIQKNFARGYYRRSTTVTKAAPHFDFSPTVFTAITR